MPKYRKKSVVVEAEQYFDSQKVGEWPSGVCKCEGREAHVHTLEGAYRILDEDWVITGVEQEQYPCKPLIFEKTYEKVESEDQPGS